MTRTVLESRDILRKYDSRIASPPRTNAVVVVAAAAAAVAVDVHAVVAVAAVVP